MNETTDMHKHLGPLQIQASPMARAPTRWKRPEGRVFHILTDMQALDQWQSNLEKLRLKEHSR